MDQPMPSSPDSGKARRRPLPNDHIPRIWGGPGNGETCDGCEETVTKAQIVMENLDATGCGVQFHVACFYVWDAERQAPVHELSGPA
jgi:hypothetical protein